MLVPTGSGIEFKAAGGESAGRGVDATDGGHEAEYSGFPLVLAALHQPAVLASASVAPLADAANGSIAADGPAGRKLPLDGKSLPLQALMPALLDGEPDEDLRPQWSLLATAARLGGPAAGDPLASMFGQQLLRPEARTADATLSSLAGVPLRGSAPAVVSSNAQPGGALSPQQPGFDQALSQRVLVFAQQGTQDARVRVHPEHLGPIEIRIRVEGDGLQVSMTSPHAAVRDALESALPRLRETLAEHGLDLGHADVGSGNHDADRKQGDSAAQRAADDPSAAADDIDGEAAGRPSRPASYALIDTFA